MAEQYLYKVEYQLSEKDSDYLNQWIYPATSTNHIRDLFKQTPFGSDDNVLVFEARKVEFTAPQIKILRSLFKAKEICSKSRLSPGIFHKYTVTVRALWTAYEMIGIILPISTKRGEQKEWDILPLPGDPLPRTKAVSGALTSLQCQVLIVLLDDVFRMLKYAAEVGILDAKKIVG